MTHRGRANADDGLAAALAAGKTVRAAATAAGVSERTAHRRLADPAFRSRVRDVRSDMVSSAAGRLADGMTRAARVLVELRSAPNPDIRHRAAVKVLELGLRVREQVVLADEVADLERRLAAVEPAAPGGGA